MSMHTVATNCRFCGYLCGVTATVEDGRVVSVEPDPSRYPYDPRIQAGCVRWPRIVEFLDHPERINFPLKRVGSRGSGEWERVSWAEALDDIAARLKRLAEEYGPEALSSSIGGPHATYWPLHRFMSVFGTPNNMGIGQICWNPVVWMNTLTFGWHLEADFDPSSTGALILWGTNPAESDNSAFWRAVRDYASAGGTLIVIDPRRSRSARHASLWLPVRPGTDCALALGLIHTIIAEDLYDHAFVERWCHGFEELRAHVADYAPELVSGITGVPADDIRKAARLFASASTAALLSGRGIDQLGRNTQATHRSIGILRAITGNVDRPGSCIISEMPDFTSEVELELSDLLSPAQRAKNLNRGHLLLQTPEGYDRVRAVTEQHGKRLPERYLTSVHPDLVMKAMLEGDPYPVRAMFVMGSNPLLTQADTTRMHAALSSLDLLVALEYTMTSTALLADYVLPVAGGLERPLFQTHGGTANIAYGGDAAVAPYYERKTDYYFFRELGLRLGQAEYWPHETLTDALAEILEPAGMSWEEYRASGLYHVHAGYAKHECIDARTGREKGFATPSGKIELSSSLLAELGADPMPVPAPVASPTAEFPLILITGARKQPYYASSYHQMPSLVKRHPVPHAEMSRETAKRLGIEEGAEVEVSTVQGRARFIAKITDMAPGVVSVEYGWWYPSESACEPSLRGAWPSNANVLTSCDIDSSDPLIGTWHYNGMPCTVTMVAEEIVKHYEREYADV